MQDPTPPSTPPAAVFERVMGAPYARLAPALQRFHRLRGRHVLHGEVATEAPASPLAEMLARALGSPRAAAGGAIRFELAVDERGEIWTRHFPGRTMASRLRGFAASRLRGCARSTASWSSSSARPAWHSRSRKRAADW